MPEPQQRAPDLRVTALAAGIALAAALPLAAATAGPGEPRPDDGRKAVVTATAASAADASGEPRPEPAPGPGTDRSPLPLPHGLLSPRASGPSGADLPETSAVCGPRTVSPRGVRAQTCVLTRDGAVWGRMYHRNTTGEALYGALSLLGPGGHAVTAPCELPADGRAGVCDTPHRRAERTSPPSLPSPEGEPYTAVAEIASPDGEGLLLRTGSETGGENGGARGAGGTGGGDGARGADPVWK
ncbi:hypothetical protein SUDANB106_02997 [Streptomyces sp. enrichment culture]|uniref:hypothetical protein n=1 Tax=Streptomyces sp. enrichment culture TaxID=1795815 RepID=UPI003F55AB31